MPSLPDLDREAWQHVQELARPAGPNGSTEHLEIAIAIAIRNHWILQIDPTKPTRLENGMFGDFELAIEELRQWRDLRGGVFLMELGIGLGLGPAKQQTNLYVGLLATEDPEAASLLALLGQRMIEQADSTLSASLGFSLLRKALGQMKKRGQPVTFDVEAWRRGIVRAISGELVVLRRSREHIGQATRPDVIPLPASDAADADENIRVMIEVLRGIEIDSSETVVIDRLRSCGHSSDNTKTYLAFTASMVERWRDMAVETLAP